MRGFPRWWINRRTLRRADRALSRLGPHLRLPPDAVVLELGCGGGGMLARLHERYRPARLVGTDFDPVEIEAARRQLTARWGALPPSIELARVDASELPYAAGTFDAVFAMMMLHHVEERHAEYLRRPKALAEVRRVLRPGGRLVYSEIFRRADVRRTLGELGFQPEFLRQGWRRDLAVYRTPS